MCLKGASSPKRKTGALQWSVSEKPKLYTAYGTWHGALQQRLLWSKGLGQVAALSHSSLTNEQQHKDDNENHKEGVAIGHYQVHEAGLENLLPSVKKTKRLRPEEKERTPGIQGPVDRNTVLHSSPTAEYPIQIQPQPLAILQFMTSIREC